MPGIRGPSIDPVLRLGYLERLFLPRIFRKAVLSKCVPTIFEISPSLPISTTGSPPWPIAFWSIPVLSSSGR
jgi:hypothetical protein